MNQLDPPALASSGRVRFSELWRSCPATETFTETRHFFAIFLTNPNKRAGGEGRNRTRPAFHKPLEINCLNHHRCLDTKGVCDLSQVNSSRLFLTPFYSSPMRFAGTSAGTFTDLFTDWFAIILMSCRRWQRRWPWPMQQGLRLQAIFSGSYPPPTLHLGVRDSAMLPSAFRKQRRRTCICRKAGCTRMDKILTVSD